MDLRPAAHRAAARSVLCALVVAVRAYTALGQSLPPTPGSTDPEISEAVVRTRARSPEPYAQELTAEDIREAPGTRSDALLALQNLPGVGRPPFGLGAFILRGSDPQDSLVTLEGQPFGLPFHFEGLSSTIATELIDHVTYLPGNFSVRYGRASGGVIDIELRVPPRDRVHTTVDADFLDAGVSASTPLGRHASIAVGARRSYLDAVLGLVAPPDSGGYTQYPRYWDYQAVLDADLGDRDNVRVTFAGSDDTLALDLGTPDTNDPSLRGFFGTHVAFDGVQARWKHRIAPGVTHTFSPAVSTSTQDEALGPDVQYAITTYGLSVRDELEARISPAWNLAAGADIQSGSVTAAVTAPPLSTNGITDPTLPGQTVRYNATRAFFNPALWAETVVTPGRGVELRAGLRADGYSATNSITLDPRVTVRVPLGGPVTLRAGFGMFSTPARGYETLPGFGNPDLTPEHWSHGTAGMVVDIIPNVLQATADAYVKLGGDIVSPSAQVIDVSGVATPLRFANTGSARCLGGEWFVRLRPSSFPLSGLVSYTYQRAELRDTPGSPWYLSPWDQTHLFTLLVSATLPHGWELGLRVRYTSGIVDPTVTGALYDADHDVSQTFVDALHPGRLPDFFAIDARVAHAFRLGPVRLQVFAQVLNATDHSNVESRIYSYDRRNSAYITGLPILPDIGLRATY